MSKKSKPLNKYEKLRNSLLEFLSAAFKEHLREPSSNYFHELFFFNDLSIQNHIVGVHRAAIHTALNDPHSYLQVGPKQFLLDKIFGCHISLNNFKVVSNGLEFNIIFSVLAVRFQTIA